MIYDETRAFAPCAPSDGVARATASGLHAAWYSPIRRLVSIIVPSKLGRLSASQYCATRKIAGLTQPSSAQLSSLCGKAGSPFLRHAPQHPQQPERNLLRRWRRESTPNGTQFDLPRISAHLRYSTSMICTNRRVSPTGNATGRSGCNAAPDPAIASTKSCRRCA